MPASRLTPLAIRNAKPRAKKYVLHDGDALDIEIQPTGRKTFYQRYRRPLDGKPANGRLGPWLDDDVRPALAKGEQPSEPRIGDALTLGRARQLASKCRALLQAKIDPWAEVLAAKRAQAEAGDRDDFEVVAARYMALYARPNTKASTFAQTANVLGFREDHEGKLTLREANPEKDQRPPDTWPLIRWRSRKVQTIQRRDVTELTDDIVAAGLGTAANSTFATLSGLFSWCVDKSICASSPCAGAKKPTKAVKRKRVLSDPELRLVWLAADRLGYPFGHLVQLLILTGARRDEWAEARWSEIGHNSGVFHLPVARSKNSLAHDIPLSPKAVAILDAVRERQLNGNPDWLFSTGRGRAMAKPDAPLRPVSGFSKAKRHLDAAILSIAREEAVEAGQDPAAARPLPDWRLHDLRRTAATNLARLQVRLEVAEKTLNHVSGSLGGIVEIYNRHDYASEVRAALQRLAQGVDRVIRGEPLVQKPKGKPALEVVAA